MALTRAQSALVSQHVPLAISVARKFCRRYRIADSSEAESEALMALTVAATWTPTGRVSLAVGLAMDIRRHLARWRKSENDRDNVEEATDPQDMDAMPRREPSPDAAMVHDERAARGRAFASVVGRLPRRQASIVRRHYGLNGGEPESVRALARRFGMSVGAVHAAIKSALATLREHPLRE